MIQPGETTMRFSAGHLLDSPSIPIPSQSWSLLWSFGCRRPSSRGVSTLRPPQTAGSCAKKVRTPKASAHWRATASGPIRQNSS